MKYAFPSKTKGKSLAEVFLGTDITLGDSRCGTLGLSYNTSDTDRYRSSPRLLPKIVCIMLKCTEVQYKEDNIDKKLRDALLKRWITRCKITHSLAFFQWRAKYEPRANQEELIEVFEDKVAKTVI